jgi:hypothetical protein
MNTTVRLALSIPAALLVLAPVAPPAIADTAPDTIIAADTTPELAAPSPAPSVSRMVGIDANIVNGLTVTGAGGSRINLTARGERTRTSTPARAKAAVFRRLTPGTAYTVRVNGTVVGSGTPVGHVGPAVGLTVSTTSAADEVLLRWNQQPTRGQGSSISYMVTARPVIALGRNTPAAEISGVTTERAATLALEPTIRYAFTVTPRNTASTGKPSTALMTRTLAELHGRSDVPAVPAPTVQPPAAPTSAPAPAPAGPSTKTIYVCPDTFTENPQGLCEKTTPYTFTAAAYTFHTEATGPAPILDSYETAVAACPGGYNLEDYGWVKYCRRYGPTPTRTVKDPTPAGYTDTGTEWSSKDAPPAGYTDNGTAWVTTTAKIPKVVPA